MKDPRYTVTYCSGATGYGWEQEVRSRKEAESIARGMSESYTAAVEVWDKEVHDFIYRKCVLDYKPEVDNF